MERRLNFVNFYPPERLEQFPTVISLGTARLGAYLAMMEYQVKLISLPLQDRVDMEAIMINDPEALGFSVNFWDRSTIQTTIQSLRQSNYLGNILLGGPEAENIQNSGAYNSDKDNILIVTKDGEIAMKCYMESVHNSSNASLQKDLDQISSKSIQGDLPVGVPLFSDDFDKLLTCSDQKSKFTWYDTLKGCPYLCGYCDHGGQKRKVTYYPEDHIEKEIKNMARQFESIFLIDPIIGGGNRIYAKNRLRQFRDLSPDIELSFYMRPETIDDELIEIISDVKVKDIYIGIQTTNSLVPSWLRQNNPSSMASLTELCKIAPVTVELIVGLPGDTMEGLKQSLYYVATFIKPSKIAAYALTVLNGTELVKISIDSAETAPKNGPWIIRDSKTHRATQSSSYTPNELDSMKKYAASFVYDYNSA